MKDSSIFQDEPPTPSTEPVRRDRAKPYAFESPPGVKGLLVISLLSLLACLWAFFFLERFQFEVRKEVLQKNIYLNSNSPDPRQSSVKEFREEDGSKWKELEMQFRMRIPGIENHPNVFQTSPGNSGIRMELSPPGNLALVVGSKNAAGFSGFFLSRNVPLNRWVQIRLSLTPGHRLTVFLDGSKVLEATDEDLAYEISSVAIGTGFNQTRPFQGELADFYLHYKFLEKSGITENMVTLARVSLLALCAVLSLILGFRNRRYLAPALFVILALCLLVRWYPEKLPWMGAKTVQHRDRVFPRPSGFSDRDAPWVFIERERARQKDIQVQFRMKISEADGYPNVFQTAPKNSGIRLEVAPPARLALVVGSKNPQGMRGFLLTEDLQAHRWYSVRLSIDRNQRVVVFLDQDPVLDIQDELLDYEISEVGVGTGFSRSRPFKGELADFQLEYRLWRRISLAPGAEVGLWAVLFILGAAMTWNLPRAAKLRGREGVFGRDDKIHLVGFLILTGFTAAVAYHYIQAMYLEAGFPRNTFLFLPQDRFNDFFNLYYQIQGQVINPWWKYLIAPPLGYLVLYPFTLLSPYWSLALFLSFFLIPFLYWNTRKLASPDRIAHLRNVLIFSFLPYPVLFALDRGNVETLSFLLVVLFISFYRKQRWGWCIFFLSLSIYMKMTPGVFLVLFLADRRFKAILYTLALTLFVFGAGIFWFGGPFWENLNALLTNLKMYQEISVIGPGGLAFGHSLFGLLKMIYQHLAPGGYEDAHNIQTLSTIYSWGAMICFGLISLYLLLKKEVLWKKVTILVFSMNLLPHVSGDYKLLYVFVPLTLFLEEKGFEEDDIVFALIFGLLLVPKAYASLDPSGLNLGVVLNPLIMLAGMLLIMGKGLKGRFASRAMGDMKWSPHGPAMGGRL